MSNLKPKIAFIGTGGTISYTGRDSLDVWEYMDFGITGGWDDDPMWSYWMP